MASPDPAPRAQFDEVLASLTQVDLLKSRQDVLASEADIAKRKADVAARVREVYERQGVKVSDELITQGVDQYFEGRLQFQKPRLGLSIVAAWAWIYRLPLLGLAGFVAGLVILANVLVYYTMVLPQREAAAARVREVQTYLASAGPQLPQLLTEVRNTLHTLEKNLQASTELNLPAITDCANVALTQLTPFADRLTAAEHRSAGALTKAESTESLEQLKARMASIQEAINETKAVSLGVNQVGGHFQQLLKADRDLDRVWKQLQQLKAPASITARAMMQRDSALEEVGRFGDAGVAQKAVALIEGTLSELRTLAGLPELIRGAAEQARLLAAEEKVTLLITQTTSVALNAVEHGDVSTARDCVNRLQNLVKQLDQTYTLRIVNRATEYSRIWYNNPTRSGKLFYVIVEAVTPDRQILPMEIVSEQDGSSRLVNCWAERVDEGTYEAVGADKKNDGIIQHDVFGKKERGYLTPHYLMGGKKDGDDASKGRLNRWPRK